MKADTRIMLWVLLSAILLSYSVEARLKPVLYSDRIVLDFSNLPYQNYTLYKGDISKDIPNTCISDHVSSICLDQGQNVLRSSLSYINDVAYFNMRNISPHLMLGYEGGFTTSSAFDRTILRGSGSYIINSSRSVIIALASGVQGGSVVSYHCMDFLLDSDYRMDLRNYTQFYDYTNNPSGFSTYMIFYQDDQITSAWDNTNGPLSIVSNYTLSSSYSKSGNISFNRFQLCKLGSGALSMKNITFYGASIINQGNNSLPIFNITYDQINNCIPSGQAQVYNATFCYNISAYDPEGDQIYYATEEGNTFNTSKTLSFNWQQCNLFTGCTDYANDGILGNFFYPYAGTCRINESAIYQANAFYIGAITVPWAASSKYALVMDGSCGSDPSAYLKFDQGYTLYQLKYTILGLNDGESLNVTVYNDALSEILAKIGVVKVNSTTTYFYNYHQNGSVDLFYNKSIVDRYGQRDQFQIEVAGQTGSKIGVSIHNMTGGDSLYARVFTQDGLNTYQPITGTDLLAKNAVITVSNESLIYVADVRYSGMVQTPIFSTTAPTCANYDAAQAAGALSYTIYISDSVHQPTQYATQTQLFYVTPPGVCTQNLKEQSDQLNGTYVNINNLVPPILYADQAIYMMQLPYRMLKFFGFLDTAIAALLLVMIFYVGYEYFRTQTFEGAFTRGFLIMSFLMLIKLMYVDLYTFIALLFSLYLANSMSNSGDESSELMVYLKGYLIFTVIMLTINVSVGQGTIAASVPTVGTVNSIADIPNYVMSIGWALLNMFNVLLFAATWLYVPVQMNFFTLVLAAFVNIYLIAMKAILAWIVYQKIMETASKIAAAFI